MIPVNTFLTDHRQKAPPQSDTLPFTKIGRLHLPGGGNCTASLVSRYLILTTAHCLFDEDVPTVAPIEGTYTFFPGYSHGPSSLISASVNWFWWGTNNPKKYRDQDWAILRLDQPLGDILGWFEVQPLDLGLSISKRYFMGGYSADVEGGEVLTWEDDCSITSSLGKELYLHNCDLARGASGGPILKNGNLVGMMVAEKRNGEVQSLLRVPYSDDVANIALSVKAFYSKLIELRKTY